MELLFEYTMRSFLGNKASHIAGQVHAEKSRREWYKKALREVVKRVQKIDAPTKQQEQIFHWSQKSLNALNGRRFSEVRFSIYLLRLVGSLLGYIGIQGAVGYSLLYHQTIDQHYTDDMISGGDMLQNCYDKQNVIGVRRRLINELKKEGLTDFEVSLALNISDYEVKKLRRNL